MIGALTDTDRWNPVHAAITSCPHCRSAEQYLAVVRQFDVEMNPRYRPARDAAGEVAATYCNIFAWDVTRAMGCEIPHWWIGHELNANGLCDWLGRTGIRFGWAQVDDAGAVAAAKLGQAVVATWRNPGGIGHIAVVIPTDSPGVRIAQAGASCLFDAPVASGFGKRPVTYYAHT